MSRARPYQTFLKLAAYAEWALGKLCVAIVLATGGGKTFVMSEVVNEEPGGVCAIAHRRELVGQISLALARQGVRHAVIAAKDTVRAIVADHLEELGRNYVDHHSRVKVAGIDTLVGMDPSDPWFASVRLVVGDEGHHFLVKNKWGKGFAMFPNARALLVTATFCRSDGKGLGRVSDGFVDAIIDGPCGRELIEQGYLTDYDPWCPTATDLDLDHVAVSETTGDFNQDQVRKAVHKSKQLVGSVVEHYLRIAPGKLGITFAIDVEEATKIAKEYRERGVPAEVVHGGTPGPLRRQILRKFKRREVLQLVNCDLFGEGYDLPAVEVISLARPTASFGLFCQQFGRVLRVMVDKAYYDHWDEYTDEQRKAIIAASGKPRAIVIDHVDNIRRLGLPDVRRAWTLNRRERRTRNSLPDAIPLRICANVKCMKPYEKIYDVCPYCATAAPAPGGRATLEQVDGDLQKLDPAVLAVMRGEVVDLAAAFYTPANLPYPAAQAARNHHQNKLMAQAALRHAIGSWAAVHPQDTDEVNYRRFYFTFGLAVVQALALNAKDAEELRQKIADKLAIDGYVISEYSPPTPPIAEQAA